MCECMCGEWCMHTRKPLICTYPCQLPSSIMLCLAVGFSDRASLSPELADWLSCLLSESFCLHLTVRGLQTRAPCPNFIWLLGSSLCFVTDTLPNGHLFDFLHAPTCTCTHTNFASLKCLASQEAGRWRVLRPPPPTYTHLSSCFLGS